MALEKFNWENGSQTEPAKVEIEGVSYNVVDAQYEGSTPLSASNLNNMQDILLGNVKDNLDDETKIPSCKAVKDVTKEVYSTEEKIVGVYIGENDVEHTLYEKTFIGSANTNANIATNWTYPIIDASVVVSKDGTGDYVSGYASASINCGIYGSFTSGNMKIYHGLSGSANYRVTVKYIKD